MFHRGNCCWVILLILLVPGCGKQNDLEVTWMSMPGACRGMIVYGYSGEALVFVVFEPVPPTEKSLESRVTTTNDGKRTRAYLTYPDGERVELPISSQLIEIVAGRLHESERRVTLGEFLAFLESKPEACTIEQLLAFVDTKGKGRAHK